MNISDVLVIVKEKVWYGLKTEVYQEIHTQQTSVRFQGVLRNLFGRGERIEAATDGSLPFFRTFSLSLTRPRFLSSHLRSHVGIHSNILNLSRTSSYHEHSRALTASLSDPSGQHELGYEAALRELYPIARDLPADEKAPGGYQAPSESIVRASIIPSTKSSLKYTYTLDRLDSRWSPHRAPSCRSRGRRRGLGGRAIPQGPAGRQDFPPRTPAPHARRLAHDRRLAAALLLLHSAVRPLLLRYAAHPQRVRDVVTGPHRSPRQCGW